ncbi:MAG: sulfatase/phosphatase domain-containing protein, partial [Proteiniphilum sp.]
FSFAFWDYLPTFAELLKQKTPVGTDGISVLPAILGRKGQKERDYFYFEFQELGGRQAVIKGDWKLLHLDICKEERFELYNLASDPSENHNLIDLFPLKAKELEDVMKTARTDHPDWPLY